MEIMTWREWDGQPGGETETEGFSDGGRGMGRGERVVRRGRGRGRGRGKRGQENRVGEGGPSKGSKRVRGEYSFDSGETELVDENMEAGGESVGERQRGGGPSGGHGGNRQGEGDHVYRRAGREEEVNRGGIWVVVGDSILRPGDIRDGLGATIRGRGR